MVVIAYYRDARAQWLSEGNNPCVDFNLLPRKKDVSRGAPGAVCAGTTAHGAPWPRRRRGSCQCGPSPFRWPKVATQYLILAWGIHGGGA